MQSAGGNGLAYTVYYLTRTWPSIATPSGVICSGIWDSNYMQLPVCGSRYTDFIVKFTGQITVPSHWTSTYFAGYTDDGFRMYVDGQLAVDNWVEQGVRWSNYSPVYDVSEDKTLDVEIWWYNGGGPGSYHLGWAIPGGWTGAGCDYTGGWGVGFSCNLGTFSSGPGATQEQINAYNNAIASQQLEQEVYNNKLSIYNQEVQALQTSQSYLTLADQNLTLAQQNLTSASENKISSQALYDQSIIEMNTAIQNAWDYYTKQLERELQIAIAQAAANAAANQTKPEPTPEPSTEPTDEPTEEPTTEPTEEPTDEPTEEPNTDASDEPKENPSNEPTTEPTPDTTEEPKDEPTSKPTEDTNPDNDTSEKPNPEPSPTPTEKDPSPTPTPSPSEDSEEESDENIIEKVVGNIIDSLLALLSDLTNKDTTSDLTDEQKDEIDSGSDNDTTPTPTPSPEPTPTPTDEPTEEPTEEPTPEPTDEPVVDPTTKPTEDNTTDTEVEPTSKPTPVDSVEGVADAFDDISNKNDIDDKLTTEQMNSVGTVLLSLTVEARTEVAKSFGVSVADILKLGEAAKEDLAVASAILTFESKAAENADAPMPYTLADAITEIQTEQFLADPIGAILDIDLEKVLNPSEWGKDMTDDQREKVQEVVIPVILVGNIVSSVMSLRRL